MATPGNQPRSLEPGGNARWVQVKQIFSSALDYHGHERELFVASECGADVELRLEVESLLASHEDAGDFIEGPPPQVKPFPGDETITLKRAPGTRIGAYELVREIGQGGMGSVYLAVRADHEFEKRVAIKLIRPGMVSDS